MSSSISAAATTLAPNARATPSMVRSSCVGPTPPLVNTTSWDALSSRTSRAISSMSSRIMTARRRRTPSSRSSRARKTRFPSATFPLKSSLPMTRAAAVRIRLALDLSDDGLALRIDAEQLLDAPLRAIEALLRRAGQAHALLEQRERAVERELSALELGDD